MQFQKGKITPDALDKCDLLFIRMPSSKYDTDKVQAIQQYLKNGGSLFMVMEVDYWSTLDQANVNDIVQPFGVYKKNNPDANPMAAIRTRVSLQESVFRFPTMVRVSLKAAHRFALASR
jgi:hypothetical protein